MWKVYDVKVYTRGLLCTIKLMLLTDYRLQPLGIVSNPMMTPNSCLGIVSGEKHTHCHTHYTCIHTASGLIIISSRMIALFLVSPKSPNYQRPRSSTTPGVHLGDPAACNHPYERLGKRRVKLKRRSYSAMLPRNMSSNQIMELMSNLSITQQTGLAPVEEDLTMRTGADHTVAGTVISHDNKNQTLSKATQSNSFYSTQGVQNLSSYSDTTDHLYSQTTAAGSTDKIRILPPVVRHGELGMKVEVKGLKTIGGSGTSDMIQTSSKTTATVDHREQCTVDGTEEKMLPQIQAREQKLMENSSHISTQAPTMKEGVSEEDNSQQKPIIHTPHDTSSRSNPSSPRRINIVSLGEVQTAKSRSKQTAAHQQKRRRRHSEGRQLSSGRLSQGWSSPKAIEPLIGSPLHTPRKQSHAKRLNKRSIDGMTVNEEQGSKIEAIRSLMTSPGLMITVDVNEFLKDTEADDPT